MRRREHRPQVLRFGSRRELTIFVGGGLVTTAAVGLAAGFLSHSITHQQALDDAARATAHLSSLVIAPLVPDYLAHDPAGTAALDRLVGDRISDGTFKEVVVWSAEGRVVYSDKAEDVGKTAPPSQELSAALAGRTTSDWEDEPPEVDPGPVASSLPPTRDDAGARLVEVYAPLRIAGQPPMVLETYFSFRPVHDLADQLLRQILPLVLIPLVLLQLIQIPVGLSLARRLRRSENERVALLQRDLSASDRERERFATLLHDGPIQELAGGSYALGAVAAGAADRQMPLVTRIQDVMQQSIQNLRGLMADLDRPDLRSGRLDHTIEALARELRAEGLDVELHLAEVPDLGHDVMATLYRVVREMLSNAEASGAGQLTITLATETDSGRREAPPRVRLAVTDDGVGFDPALVDQNSERYLRLRLLHDRVADLGGELLVSSSPGGGTTVRVDVPWHGGALAHARL